MDETQAVAAKPTPLFKDKMKTGLLCAYAIIFLVLRAAPWKPEKYVLSFDISWDLALHYLTSHGATFGQNLIFTFGPLGFAYARTYYPDDYLATLTVWSLLSTILGITLFKFAHCAFSRGWTQFLWLTLAITTIGFFTDSFFFAFAICILCDYFLFDDKQTRPSKTAMLLALALGVGASVKFTFVMSAAIALALITLDEIIRRKRIPILAPIAGTTFLAIWLFCGQPLSLLFDFVRFSLEVTRGYSDTLALGTSYAQICTTALLACIAFIAMCYTCFRRLKLWSIEFGMALGGVLFAMFKAAYVRHDPGHGTIAAMGFTFFCLLLIACVYQDRSSKKVEKAIAQSITAAFLLIVIPWNFGTAIYSFPLLVADAVFKAGRNATLIPEDLFVRRKNLSDFERGLVAIRDACPVPALSGGVDAYPIDAKLIVANRLSYSPRPLLQSYQSYTTALLDADTKHLTEANAPQWLLLSGKPWEDNWLPSLNDGPSFIKFLTLYEQEKLVGDQVLMKRRTSPLTSELIPLKEFDARLNEAVDLSAYNGKMLWAQITPQLSSSGELARFVYHVLPLSIDIELNNQPVKKFVAPRALLTEGFLLSPFFEDSVQLSKVMQSDASVWQKLSVSKITLEDRNPKAWNAYRPTIHIKLFELKI